jgi:hypothetical protein
MSFIELSSLVDSMLDPSVKKGNAAIV